MNILTVRDLAFISSYLSNGMNATEAYLSLNPKVSRESAGVLGARKLKKVRNPVHVQEIFALLGIDLFQIGNELKEALEATFLQKVMEIEKDEEGNPVLDKKGRPIIKVRFAKIPDHPTRLGAIDRIKAIAGLDAPGKHEIAGSNGGPVELKIVFDKKKGNGANGGNGEAV